ncbi:hypothetical protein M011DRAFT_481917 [Sporormia fimetaria CBS 119925]|uniref:Uncharacterized protein n=1 Tax=Sporormia fimetaria CBS 119925 TaxID=1340428 RepID=A0A6A6UXH1_9PLEO|nr:hypothetical protein M011DRAFT_481917 [Sporormia fimetaria CBS 119925]
MFLIPESRVSGVTSDPHFIPTTIWLSGFYKPLIPHVQKSKELLTAILENASDKEIDNERALRRYEEQSHADVFEWPSVLCRYCGTCHTPFDYSTCHPQLRGLRDLPLCISGHGSRLVITIGRKRRPEMAHQPATSLEPRTEDLDEVREWVRSVGRALRREDMFTRPACERLVVTSTLKYVERFVVTSGFPERGEEGFVRCGDVVKALERQVDMVGWGDSAGAQSE